MRWTSCLHVHCRTGTCARAYDGVSVASAMYRMPMVKPNKLHNNSSDGLEMLVTTRCVDMAGHQAPKQRLRTMLKERATCAELCIFSLAIREWYLVLPFPASNALCWRPWAAPPIQRHPLHRAASRKRCICKSDTPDGSPEPAPCSGDPINKMFDGGLGHRGY